MVIHPSLPTSAELIKESVIVAPCQLVTHRTTATLNTEQATESLEIEASLSFPKGHTSWPKWSIKNGRADSLQHINDMYLMFTARVCQEEFYWAFHVTVHVGKVFIQIDHLVKNLFEIKVNMRQVRKTQCHRQKSALRLFWISLFLTKRKFLFHKKAALVER